ncbi:MAG TPA: methyltransferase domain-containing protein [Pricia sp.]|nr:methyltransferase domain-containing protein [Pricia sp.]
MENIELNEEKLEAFLGQFVNDFGAMASGVMTAIGFRLGLYKAMKDAGPLTSAELAQKTETAERYVREWLNNQAAGGYVKYDAAHNTYEMPLEQAMVLANPESPFYLVPGMVKGIPSMWADEDKVVEAFKTGKGIGWHQHDHRLFYGTEHTFRPGYRAYLTQNWIPALQDVEEKLMSGGKVADIGCGHGASTIVMAEAYPHSEFFGFDYHKESIETARERAREAGVENRVAFEVFSAKDYPGEDYDLISFMDCFHDLGDPLGAAQKAFRALKKNGTLLLVEPYAGNQVEDNINPVGRMYYAFSTTICCANSLSQEVGTALGAQAGEEKLGTIVRKAGFTQFRRATETPFNLVLEAKP